MNEDNLAATTTTTLHFSSDYIDSCSSTPFVSAPSSPGREIPISTGFYFSAPSSPMHYILSNTSLNSYSSSLTTCTDASFQFDLPSSGAASADELFFNGQIRPMKLSTHLQRPQLLDPLLEEEHRAKIRAGSLRRRTRSMSPLRNFDHENQEDSDKVKHVNVVEEERCTTRSSSAGRNSSSKRWVFLKEFLYRSKSEGRNHNHDGHNNNNNNNKFWVFSPSSNKDKDKDKEKDYKLGKKKSSSKSDEVKRKVVNGNRVGKRNSVASAHEMHYTAKRAQAEEMRKRTFLPYRQGLLGCLGFSAKSFGAMNGLAKVLNPTVSTS